MSTLAANNITDAAGTGGPTLANGLTIGTSVLAAPSGSAPSYTCRAWVNFNGTGTVAIREDGNVSSITDNGTGDYTVNFTTAMPDDEYVVVAGSPTGNNGSNITFIAVSNSHTTTNCRVLIQPSGAGGGGRTDSALVNVAIFR